MQRTKRHSLITIAIVISIVIHLLIFIIVPSFSIARPYEYTLHDLSFLIGELNAQKNNRNPDTYELKSKPVTTVNKSFPVSLHKSADVNKIIPDKLNDSVLNTSTGEKKVELKKVKESASRLTSQQARELLKEIENSYNKNSVSGDIALHRIEKSYLEKVREQIQARYFIPEEAQRQNLRGKVTLKMKVGRSGKLIDVNVVKYSDFPILDMAAIAAVKAAVPFPNIADKIDLEYLSITVPFIYP